LYPTEAVDGSRRSLRSLSLENNLSEVGESVVTTPVRPLKLQPFTDPGSLRDTSITDVSYKAPSYLGISCAVNGYSRLNRYDSSLRDGFRSRDASPARLAFSRSRDSSPMRPEWKVFDLHTKASPQATAAKIRELKEELARFKAEFPHPPGERGRQSSSRKLGRRPSQGRSVSVDRGYLVKSGSREKMNGLEKDMSTQGAQRVRLVEINMTDSQSVKSSSYQYSFEQSIVRGGLSDTSDSILCSAHSNGDSPDTKSFIQSRIERLYGPSALGAGFRSRRSLLELEKEQKDRESGVFRSPVLPSQVDNLYEPEAKAPEGFPSVFRHLRPEFRTQLQVKRSNRLKPGISLELPSINNTSDINSPKRPGRVIPIILTDTFEKNTQKPPVPQPKPEVPITNEASRENKVLNRDSKPVVQKIINGNGNIKETDATLEKETCVNGSAIEDKVSVKEEQESTKRTSNVNGVSDSVNLNGNFNKTSEEEEKDGHYFLKVVEGVVKSIEAQVVEIESDLEARGSEMSEEVRGKVLAAIGKARLLVSQKIRQFQGLCHKNISGTIGEEFPTTCQDLAGFWDMVSIQVEDIRNSIQEIVVLRTNGWKEVNQIDTIDGANRNVTTGHARRKPAPRPSRPAKFTKGSAEKTEEGKSRDEARKKMMEERRKAMKEAMKAKKAEAEARKAEQDDEAPVEIFVPDSK
ncbi:Disks large-associated protein 4-like, partial [Homarus americanus]